MLVRKRISWPSEMLGRRVERLRPVMGRNRGTGPADRFDEQNRLRLSQPFPEFRGPGAMTPTAVSFPKKGWSGQSV